MTNDGLDAFGVPIEQRSFTGVFDGVTVALYRLPEWADASAGTHFTALTDPWETQVMPIGTEAEARRLYRFTIDGILAEEAEQIRLQAGLAAQKTLN